MKNCVSLETANALKEAGFVAPNPEMLQAYYIQGAFFYITKTVDGSVFIAHKDGGEPTPFSLEWLNACTFAPSAIEILDQMSICTTLIKDKAEWFCQLTGILSANKCPHEAAASAFLMWKSKKP